MSHSYSFCKHAQTPLFPGGLNSSSMNFHNNHKNKVVFVMGATGTGKSKLSIDLAIQLQAEIINSDKIQVYKGLDIVTNKVTEEECRGVPHHLLRIIDPDVEYNANDFRRDALLAIESIIEQDKLPIIAGGSNSFIESLVNDHPDFTSKYECCFLWVDLSLPILQCFVSERVDQMVKAGLVDEVRGIFDPEADYTQGIRRAIGVPELDSFLRAEGQNVDPEMLETLLQVAIDEIKANTCKLACRQLQKIHRLRDFWGWNLHHIDATEVFLKQGKDAQEAWQRLVVGPSAMIVRQFLNRNTSVQSIPKTSGTTVIRRGYYGGHTDAYKKLGRNLFYYDVNSLYPFIIKKGPMPGGKPVWDGNMVDKDIDSLFGFIEAFVSCPSSVKKPFLPVRGKDGTLLFPTGDFVGVYYSEELKYARDIGYTVIPECSTYSSHGDCISLDNTVRLL